MRQRSALGPARASLVLGAISAIGVLVAALATRWGVGLSPDSVVYVTAARNLLGGRGLTVVGPHGALVLMPWFPPLFPLLLAAIGLLRVDPPAAARWANAFLFGANIFAVGTAVRWLTKNLRMGLLASVLVLASYDLSETHTWAWSEPLFLFLLLVGLSLTSAFIVTGRARLMVLAGLGIGISCVARYAGAALVLTGALSILLFRDAGVRRRFLEALVFAVLASLPVGIWMAANRAAGGGGTSREFAFHLPDGASVRVFNETVSLWFAPGRIPYEIRTVLGLLALLGLSACGLHGLGGRRSDGRTPSARAGPMAALPRLLGVFVPLYVGFIFLSVTVADAHTLLDFRILAPVHVAALILLAFVAHHLLSQAGSRRPARWLITLALFGLCAFQAWRLREWFQRQLPDGQGYASRTWRESPTVLAIERLPKGIPIYSNVADGLQILTGRDARMLPQKTDFMTLAPNPHFAEELSYMREALAQKGGVVAYFRRNLRGYVPSQQEITQLLPLRPLSVHADGTIFVLEDASVPPQASRRPAFVPLASTVLPGRAGTREDRPKGRSANDAARPPLG